MLAPPTILIGLSSPHALPPSAGSGSPPSLHASSATNPGIGPRNIRYVERTLIIANDSRLSGNVGVLNSEHPTAIALDTRTNSFLVASWSSSTISVINATSDATVLTVRTAARPYGLAFDAASSSLLVALGSSNISVLNASTLKPLGQIAASSTPAGIADDPHNASAFVAVGGSNQLLAVSPSSRKVLATITTGSGPSAVAYDPSNDLIAATNLGGSSITVVNATTYRVASTITVGLAPDGIAYDARAGSWLVASRQSSTVSIVNASTGSVTATLSVGKAPAGIVYDATNGTAFVANNGSSNLTVLGGSPLKVVTNLPTGPDPVAAAFDPTGNELAVLWNGEAAVGVEGASSYKPIATVLIGADPTGLAWDSTDGLIEVSDAASNLLEAINESTGRIVASVGAGAQPRGVAFDSLSDTLGVVDSASNLLTVVKAPGQTVAGSAPTGSTPVAVAYNGINNTFLVVNAFSANVSIISPASGKTIAVAAAGSGPSAIAYDSTANTAYIANFGSANISVVSAATGAPKGSLTAGTLPDAVLFDAANNTVYEANGQSNNLSVFLARTGAFLARIAVGSGPAALAEDAVGGVIFTANAGSSNVSVIDPVANAVTANIAVGADPDALAYDGSTRTLYVANGQSGTITEIAFEPSETYNLSFAESGLAKGTQWNITIAGVAVNSTTPWINISLENGSYAYRIDGLPGLTTNWTGTATVNGGPVRINVTFVVTTYPVTFTESGLPKGTVWNVSVGGQATSSSTSSLAIDLPNGTFAYAVVPIPGYTATWRGSVTVSAAPQTVGLVFARETYSVVFQEAGLPSGQFWSIDVNGGTYGSSSPTISLPLANGTYPYLIHDQSGYHQSTLPYLGNVTVNGAPPGLPTLLFLRVTYNVTFQATGLPTGTAWSVVWPSGNLSSTGGSAIANVPNGTYSYRFGFVAGFQAGAGGVVTVTGADVVVAVTFRTSTFVVALDESGLPTGTLWAATLNNTTVSSTGPELLFDLPNGSFTYRVTPVSGYSTAWSGSVEVVGLSVELTIAFTLFDYPVTFREDGLANGTNWSVAVGSVSNRSAIGSLVLELPNGSRSYTVARVGGYAAVASGAFTVSGAALTIPLRFNAITYLVEFEALGIPAGANWSLDLSPASSGAIVGGGSATRWSDGDPGIVVSLSNGTFNYEVGASGFFSRGGSVQVLDGTDGPVTVTLTPNGSPGHGLLGGGSDLLPIALGIGAAAVVAAVAGLLLARRRRRRGESGEGEASAATPDEPPTEADGPVDGEQPPPPEGELD